MDLLFSSPSAETNEGTGINITCSHPSILSSGYIHWYRQLPGRGPAFLVSAVRGSKEVPDPEGQVFVSADRRSSALWLARPRLGDAAVYYCAVDTRGAKPGLTTCRGHRHFQAIPTVALFSDYESVCSFSRGHCKLCFL
uniref:Ig-like domain-containing protein n=1 Tax=Phasianus colchicus TaxID=9054 RepID=A0A669QT44_PHACC